MSPGKRGRPEGAQEEPGGGAQQLLEETFAEALREAIPEGPGVAEVSGGRVEEIFRRARRAAIPETPAAGGAPATEG